MNGRKSKMLHRLFKKLYKKFNISLKELKCRYIKTPSNERANFFGEKKVVVFYPAKGRQFKNLLKRSL